jgi:hypothetical protein
MLMVVVRLGRHMGHHHQEVVVVFVVPVVVEEVHQEIHF